MSKLGSLKRAATPLRLGAGFFGLVSFAFVIWLAALGASEKPMTNSTAVGLTAFAAISQGISSFMWSQAGKAHPTHARSAVRRLGRVFSRSAQYAALAQAAYETGTDEERRLALGRLSAGLDTVTEDAEDAIADWYEFHKDALPPKDEPKEDDE